MFSSYPDPAFLTKLFRAMTDGVTGHATWWNTSKPSNGFDLEVSNQTSSDATKAASSKSLPQQTESKESSPTKDPPSGITQSHFPRSDVSSTIEELTVDSSSSSDEIDVITIDDSPHRSRPQRSVGDSLTPFSSGISDASSNSHPSTMQNYLTDSVSDAGSCSNISLQTDKVLDAQTSSHISTPQKGVSDMSSSNICSLQNGSTDSVLDVRASSHMSLSQKGLTDSVSDVRSSSHIFSVHKGLSDKVRNDFSKESTPDLVINLSEDKPSSSEPTSSVASHASANSVESPRHGLVDLTTETYEELPYPLSQDSQPLPSIDEELSRFFDEISSS